TKIRVFVTRANGGQWSAITEVEAYASSSAPSPDFSIAANPSSLTLTQGTTGTSTVTVTAVNGFSGSVGLSVTGCPSGATWSAASSYPDSETVPATANDGDRRGTGGYWNDNTLYVFPDWLEVAFSGTQTINEIDVFTLQNTHFTTGPVDPTLTTLANLYGIRD